MKKQHYVEIILAFEVNSEESIGRAQVKELIEASDWTLEPTCQGVAFDSITLQGVTVME